MASKMVSSNLLLLLIIFGSCHSEEKMDEPSSHFPRMPGEDGGADFVGFVAVSTGVDRDEEVLMVSDLVGRPLGADPYDHIDTEEEDEEGEGEVVDTLNNLEGGHFEGDIKGVFITSLDNFKHNGV